MDHRRLHAVRAGRRHPQRPFVHPGRHQSDHRHRRAITHRRLRFENPAYTTYDASIGVAKDAWYGERSTARTSAIATPARSSAPTVHRRADAAAAAGARRGVRLQILGAPANRRRGVGGRAVLKGMMPLMQAPTAQATRPDRAGGAPVCASSPSSRHFTRCSQATDGPARAGARKP